jgi:hypothetical protein
MTSRFDLFVPVELVSEANMREHWAVKRKRKKRQRELVRHFDNLVGSFKAVIDEMAELLGVDDSTIRWPELRTEAFSQRQAAAMGCRIKVEQWTA